MAVSLSLLGGGLSTLRNGALGTDLRRTLAGAAGLDVAFIRFTGVTSVDGSGASHAQSVAQSDPLNSQTEWTPTGTPPPTGSRTPTITGTPTRSANATNTPTGTRSHVSGRRRLAALHPERRNLDAVSPSPSITTSPSPSSPPACAASPPATPAAAGNTTIAMEIIIPDSYDPAVSAQIRAVLLAALSQPSVFESFALGEWRNAFLLAQGNTNTLHSLAYCTPPLSTPRLSALFISSRSLSGPSAGWLNCTKALGVISNATNITALVSSMIVAPPAISLLVPSPYPTPSPLAVAPSPSHSPGAANTGGASLTEGAKLGIGFGIFGAFLLVLVLVALVMRQRKQKSAAEAALVSGDEQDLSDIARPTDVAVNIASGEAANAGASHAHASASKAPAAAKAGSNRHDPAVI